VIYSHTSELAIRATLYLALQPPGKLSPIRQIARDTGLPGPYLAKITRRLIQAGLVRAFRGPGGGLELGRAPEAITLWTVVAAVDAAAPSKSCLLGVELCSEDKPCPLHLRWWPLETERRRLLEETTIATLAKAMHRAAKPVRLRRQPGPAERVRRRSNGHHRERQSA
jgi:Rrf2 family transcriptional regulator, iron-sulfur cluster assembly transcription factor